MSDSYAASITLTADQTSVDVGTTVNFTAYVYDQYGAGFPYFFLTFSSINGIIPMSNIDNVSYSCSTTSSIAETVTYTVSNDSLSATCQVTYNSTVPPPPPADPYAASITLTINETTAYTDMFVTFTARIYDQFGAPILCPAMYLIKEGVIGTRMTDIAPGTFSYQFILPSEFYYSHGPTITFTATDLLINGTCEVTYTIPTPPPSPPIVIISDVNDTTIIVNWTGDSSNTTYDVRLDGVLPEQESEIPNGFFFRGLTPSTTYSIMVTGTNSGGSTSSTVSVTTLAPQPPSQFVSIDFSEFTAVSFKVTWVGGEGASSYTYTLNGVAAIPTTDMALESKFVVFSGLSPSTLYQIVITATNANGSTSTPTDAPYYTQTETLLKPYNITATSVTTTSITLTWEGGVGATSYEYFDVKYPDLVLTVIDNGVSSKTVTFTGLSPNNSYLIRINAINSNAGENEIASASTIYGQSTLSPPPTKPILSLGLVTSYTLSVYWVGDTVSHESYTYTLNGIETSGTLEGGGVLEDGSQAICMGTFGNLTPSTTYSVVVTAFNSMNESVSSDPVSVTTLAPAPPPTVPVLIIGSITSSSFVATWEGNSANTSYTFQLNGAEQAPQNEAPLTYIFRNLTPSTTYSVTLVAFNINNESVSSAPVSVTTLAPPAPPTPEAVAAIQSSFSGASGPAAATSAIEAAIAANLSPETIVAAALAVGITSPTMFTALVSNPAFQGTTVSVPAAVATTLYAAMTSTTINTSLPLYVNFPAADGSVTAPAAGSNSKLAIDLTATGFFPFAGCTGYGINVIGGVQYFVTPTNQTGTLVVVGEQITFTPNGGVPITFTIADLDVVLMPYTPAPPAVVCFLGSAPVLTPSGYKRIDRLAVGDLVKTPTGTATIEAIKKQVCEPSSHTNPYVIPEGKLGANRKLHISPRHKVLVNGEMIEARDLGLIQEEQSKAFTYYNLQITKSQNMIVAGVEVESLKPLVRVTITREAFDYIVKTKFGGRITQEIRSKCIMLPDGRVSVPSIRQ